MILDFWFRLKNTFMRKQINPSNAVQLHLISAISILLQTIWTLWIGGWSLIYERLIFMYFYDDIGIFFFSLLFHLCWGYLAWLEARLYVKSGYYMYFAYFDILWSRNAFFFVRTPFLCSANDLLYFVISNTLRSITETTKLLTFYHCVNDFSSIFDKKNFFVH